MKKVLFSSILTVALVAVFSSTSLFAEPEMHDGIYLNFQIGAGPGKTVIEDFNGKDLEFCGPTAVFRFKLGVTPADNFIVYGVYGAYNQDEPEITYGSQTNSKTDFVLAYNDLGGGICYYFMPVNIYISAEIAITQLTVQSDTYTSWDSEAGRSLTLSIGKEWWVSDDWGIGIALILRGASMKAGSEITDEAENKNDTITHGFAGLAFTATYN